MKTLYITTVGGTMTFFNSFIGKLLKKGNIVDIATNEDTSEVPQFYRDNNCKIFHINTSRNPFSLGNIKAISQIKKLADTGKYDIIHCHTPLAAMCTRLACIDARKSGTKLIYTAHGFHFYKGAPLKNWMIFFPVEWICSFLTDVLITINKEDYHFAKRHLHAKSTVYVPGIGIDTEKFRHGDGQKIRNELGISDDEIMLLSVGELNENKNHITVINALSKLKNPPVYVIVGKGDLADHLQSEAERLGVRVILTGYRPDVMDIYAAADIYILPSLREGLNVSLMEAMASGLPCAVSKIRGNVDLIDSYGGALFNPTSVFDIQDKLKKLIMANNSKKMSEYNQKKILRFSKEKVDYLMLKIYKSI